MGLCTSIEVASPATVKLIMPDGGLREFSWPVRPAYILGKDEGASFVCDSDTMEIDGIVAATAADKELRLGQIYFVLPRSMLNRPLKAEEMAALVVRASGALEKVSGGKKGRKGAVAPLMFEIAEECEEEEKRRGGARKGSGRGCKFSPDLSAIPE